MNCVMDHIVLNVENEDAMLAFYQEILTLPAERLEEYRAQKPSFPSVRLNAGTIIDLFPKRMWMKVKSSWIGSPVPLGGSLT